MLGMEASGQRVAGVTGHARRRTSIFFLLLASLLWPGMFAHADDTPRRVLLLHAFNYTFPSTTQTSDAMRRRLLEQSRQKIEIDADFLDLVRASDPGYELRTAHFLREKYSR